MTKSLFKAVFSALAIILVSTLPLSAQTSTEDRAEVLLETNYGNIRLQLYNETPLHRDNFLQLVRTCFFDSLLYHRVIPDFMIQCGDPTSRNAAPGVLLGDSTLPYTIAPEIRLPQIYHKRGALAMARENDDVNPERRSCSTQFYIVYGKKCNKKTIDRARKNLKRLFGDSITLSKEMETTYKTTGGTPHLDGGYTVFGEVVEGLDVVDKIQNVECDENDRPLSDVRIIRATIVRDINDEKMHMPSNKNS